MTNLEIALTYRARGWSIIPIKNKTKVPAIKSWAQFQDRLPTEAEIKTWFMMDAKMGLALICGKVSGVIAVDIDKKSGGQETAKDLNLPPTLVSNTGGGGNHYLYKWREGLVSPKVGLYPGIDIRSDKSYIVLPPTMHDSGNIYEWALDDTMELAPAPKWLEADQQTSEKKQNDWDKIFKEPTGEGLRNMTATKMAGKIIYEISPDTWDTLGLSLFKQWNKDFNVPSLPKEEVMVVWNSIKSKHQKNNPAPVEDDETTQPGDLTEEEEKRLIVKSFLKNKTKGTYDLAMFITNKYNIITVGEKEHEMFVYREGIYTQAENEVILPEIQRVLQHHVTKNAKTETLHKIADMTAYGRSIFDLTPLYFIPLHNGIYNFQTKELLPHASTYKFKYKFPIHFDPAATCPKTEAFLTQILSADQIATVQEWVGYYFYRLYMFKKAIIFVGEGDTGKTTLLEVITYLLGRNNISSVSLQKMSSDKFSAAHLYEKHGNIVDELSVRDISDTGAFKVATGGGSITGEYKFGNQFGFHNFSKFTFACNKIPDVTDFDDIAYFNRWMVIRFEKAIEKKIPNFIKTLTTEEERSGLFNWAMVGLERLLTKESFTYASSAMDTKKEMMRSGSSIAMFCADCLKQKIGEEISKEEMYEAYSDYCHKNELSVETIKMLGTKLPFYVSYVSDGLITTQNKHGKADRVRGWRNVAIILAPAAEKTKQDLEKQFNEF